MKGQTPLSGKWFAPKGKADSWYACECLSLEIFLTFPFVSISHGVSALRRGVGGATDFWLRRSPGPFCLPESPHCHTWVSASYMLGHLKGVLAESTRPEGPEVSCGPPQKQPAGSLGSAKAGEAACPREFVPYLFRQRKDIYFNQWGKC